MHTDIRGQKQETMHAWFKNNKILFLQYTTCDKEYVMATRMPNPKDFIIHEMKAYEITFLV